MVHVGRGLLPFAGLLLAYASTASGAPFAYIPNAGDDTVSVIDTATNTVTATVPVGHNPVGVAVHPAGSRVYVTNFLDNTVSVIDAATNTVIATVVAGLPVGVVVSPDGSVFYVVEGGFSGTVAAIDTTTHALRGRFAVRHNPLAVAVTPDGSRLYVTNGIETAEICSTQRCLRNVSVIDTALGAEVSEIELADDLGAVAVNPAGTRAYIQAAILENDGQYTATVAAIDTATNSVAGGTVVGNADTLVLLFGLAVHPDGTRVYSSFGQPGALTVIDAATNAVITAIPVGLAPGGVSVTPDGRRVYVTVRADKVVAVIDTATNTVIDRIPVGVSPTAFGQFIGPENPILTPQPTGTPTPSPAPSRPTATATPTQSLTSTSTASPTQTATLTATSTATRSPTNPATPTATFTLTPTATPTGTHTPSVTPSRTEPPTSTLTPATATGGSGGCSIVPVTRQRTEGALLFVLPAAVLAWRRRSERGAQDRK